MISAIIPAFEMLSPVTPGMACTPHRCLLRKLRPGLRQCGQVIVAGGGGDGGGTACVTGGGEAFHLVIHLRSLRDDGKAFGKQSRAVGQELAN